MRIKIKKSDIIILAFRLSIKSAIERILSESCIVNVL